MIRVLRKKEDCGFDWIDISAPKEEELREIALKYKLHMPSVMDCLHPEHLPKYELIDNLVFIIVRVYDPHATEEADTIQETSRKIAIFFSNDNLITIHRSEQPILTELVDNKRCTSGMLTVFNIIMRVFLSYEAPGYKLLKNLDHYESMIFLKKTIPHVLKALYHLKRKASVNKRILHLSKDILEHLDDHNIPETLLQDLRDLFIRVETMYDEAQEGVTNLLNIYISLSSQKTNEVVRVLTVFSVFFMPLTFIVGIYGMNFEYMPELSMKYGYPAVLGFMVLFTLVIYQWFKRKGWL